MQYSSVNGCLFYYDRCLYSWRVCEPTMLFLLGFESIISFDKSNTDTITVARALYDNNLAVEVPLKDFNIFDDIHNYLSSIGSVEDFNKYLKFNCYGLKLLLNELTGTGTDRTIPIIFKNDVNKILINLDSKMFRLPESERSKKSYFDLQAQKIKDIFDDADYSDNNITQYETNKLLPESENTAITNFNSTALAIDSERASNSQIYKLFDYKAMYSYALGVLYGCCCLGYDKTTIWHVSPKYWYNGTYQNLVNTAWVTFRKHFVYSDLNIADDADLRDKYIGTQQNELWNFENSINGNAIIANDEQQCILANTETSIPILYSKSITTYPKGAYLNLTTLSDIPVWQNVALIIKDTTLKTGVISIEQQPLIRYIANDAVKIFKAYKYSESEYLAPDADNIYFINVGKLGWCSFNELGFNAQTVDTPVLSLGKMSFDELPQDNINFATNKTTGDLVTYYKCYTDDSKLYTLYGIFDNKVVFDAATSRYIFNDSTNFVNILSDKLFNENFVAVDTTGVTTATYFNIDKKITLLMQDSTHFYTSVATNDTKSIAECGYSKTPSVSLDAYTLVNDKLTAYDLRYNKDTNSYWSSLNNEWTSEFPTDTYIKTTKNISLYKNIECLSSYVSTYTKSYNKIDTSYYIFNNTIYGMDTGFITLDALYNIGITPYLCAIIAKDETGISLYDENNKPLVWYDAVNNKYWNGLFGINKWQDEKPVFKLSK